MINLFKLRKHIPLIAAIILFIGAIVISFFVPKDNQGIWPAINDNTAVLNTNTITPINGTYLTHSGEMKAVWVPYMSLTPDDNQTTEQAFKEKFDRIIQTAKENKMNTLIVHVRPYGDALYPSEYYPWSHVLTGEQGKDPGYDPLNYMLEASHKAGLEFHAWINPLRIKVSETPQKLSKDNLKNKWKDTKKYKDYVIKWEDGYYLNPAKQEVRETIIKGVEEIVRNYAVDGIHFDDYFYPTSESSFDKDSYQEYIDTLDEECNPLVLPDWRCANINKLISGVYAKIHSLTDQVTFGVSPQGNINNDLEMGADVYSWCKTTGYVDYICPQIYVNFDHALLPYDNTAKEWKKLVTNKEIKYYIGLAVYKAGSEEDDGTWENKEDILKKQVEYGREVGADGFMLYAWDYLDNKQTKKEIENVMAVL